MRESMLTGLWAGYAVAIPVGALAVYLVNVTARTSFRVGASGALGVATADGLYAIAAVLGGTTLSHAAQVVTGPLRSLAAVILIVIAARIVITAVRSRNRPPLRDAHAMFLGQPIRAYLGFLGLTLLNPWTLVYFGVLMLGGHMGPATGTPALAAFAAAVFAASASWQLFLATGGAMLGHTLTSPRGRIVTALISSLAIAALALLTVTEGWR